MPSKKMPSTTIIFFKADFDIGQYLVAPVGQTEEEVSRESRGNFWQFRDIDIGKSDVCGRLCKIKTLPHKKPVLGDLAAAGENRPRKHVIESVCFCFKTAEKVLICEKKGAVSPMPNRPFLLLLRHIYQKEIKRNSHNIDVMVRTDVLEHLKSNKELIKVARLRLSAKAAYDMYSKDGNFPTLGSGIEKNASRELAVEIKYRPGKVTESWLTKIVALLKAGKIMSDSKMIMEGEPSVELSGEFVRSQTMSFKEGKDEDETRKNLYASLRNVAI